MVSDTVVALCLPPETGRAVEYAGPHDPEAVLARAAALGAFPAVFRNLQALGTPLPEDWHRRFRRNLARNLTLRREESTLVERLAGTGIRGCAIKGVRLVERLYPDLSWRAVADIDLLVPPAEVERAYWALKRNGLEDEVAPWNARSLARQVAQPAHAFAELKLRSRQGTLVEVHWDWWGEEFPAGDPAEEHETFLLYLAIHAGKHSWTSLQNLTDLELYLRKYGGAIDWEKYWKGARRSGWERLAAVSLAVCATLFRRPARRNEQWVATRGVRLQAGAAARRLLAETKPWWWRSKPLRLLRIYSWRQRASRCWLWLAPPPWDWNHPEATSTPAVWMRRYRRLLWQGLARLAVRPAWRRRCERAAELSARDWLVVARALATLSVVRLGMATMRYERLKRWASAVDPRAVSLPNREAILRIAWLVDVAANHHPTPMRCLARSLTLARILGRRGVSTDVKIGVRSEDGRLHAHAWTEWQGEPINDPYRLVSGYAELQPAAR